MATQEELLAEARRRGLEVPSSDRSALLAEAQRRGLVTDEQPVPQEDSFLDDTVDVVAEFASSVNRTVGEVVDFFGPDTANAILSLTEKGIGKLGGDVELPRVPTSKDIPGIEGGFMEPGLARDVTRASGQTLALGGSIGAIGRKAATLLPTQFAGESLAVGTARQLAATTPAQDVTLGALSGAGSAVGRESGGDPGALVGGLFTPLAATASKQALTGLINQGAKGIAAITRSLSDLSDDGASKLLAEAMVREGIGPDDIARRMAELGPEAIPADLGNNFARLLRTASNQIPRIEGRTAEVLTERQLGQAGRIVNSFEDATGTASLNVDDQITLLNKTAGQQANDLYAAARAKDFKILSKESIEGIGTGTPIDRELIKSSRKLKGILGNNKSSVGKAALKTRQTLDDKRAAGDVVGDIDFIDATKRVLDDQIQVAIRQGRKNRVRDLVRGKNALVEEADKVVPEYKQARDFFAGKAQLESAAETGGLFMKLKPREVEDLVSTMSASEKEMFVLGSKQAIIDRIESLQTNSDAIKRLFGKNGDVKKLQSLFDDESAFNNFSEALKRESQFILTRNAARGNSTTAQQTVDIGNAGQALESARALAGDPIAASNKFGQIVAGLATKKQSEANIAALEQAGDILLASGMNPDRLLKILLRGNREEIQRVLESTLLKESKVVAPTAQAVVASQIGQRENP